MNESVSVRELARKARAAAAPLSAARFLRAISPFIHCRGNFRAHSPASEDESGRCGAGPGKKIWLLPLLSRLQLTEAKCRRMIEELQALAGLPDPLGTVSSALELSEGLELYRVSCPIGVIGVIFESRPDALVRFPPPA